MNATRIYISIQPQLFQECLMVKFHAVSEIVNNSHGLVHIDPAIFFYVVQWPIDSAYEPLGPLSVKRVADNFPLLNNAVRLA